ncbi:hypothetical protein [Clostridium tagluense]|uniref:hypothetical protein n=1 Tax=Clostridium tagluense TaxID=360422 RepID=UPI001CF5453D|nr:hypothetical protein [Clostridium tagluense]MCB2300575.1 hypothetical protein [Clostridium tagluense]
MDKTFNEKNFNEKLMIELTSNSKDIAIDYTEMGLDLIFDDDIIKEIPILKTIASI